MLEHQLKTLVERYRDPYLDKDLLSLKAIQAINVMPDEIRIELALPYPCALENEKIAMDLGELLSPFVRDKRITLKLTAKIEAHVAQIGVPALAQIKNIIAVGSGKGGVGKSTMALSLALALQKEGARVGLLDADIYGPSLPTLLGVTEGKPDLHEGKLLPIYRYGLASMSIGYLVEAHAAVVWRGPMLGKAIQQLLNDTLWDNLDYLIVDLPPGTGDVPLTLCQKIPLTGAVLVTTPQDLALADVRRAAEMFQKLGTPILGVVENMSYYQCAHCDHEEFIFGSGGGEKLSQEFNTILLGSIPLAMLFGQNAERISMMLEDKNSLFSKHFLKIACKAAARVALQAKAFKNKFPKIVVEQGNGEK